MLVDLQVALATVFAERETAISQRPRWRFEEIFGWAKSVGGFRRTRLKGRERTQPFALIVGTAYNLMRMARFLEKPAAE